ncbi:MAG TPA: hypothetical protein ENJ87_04710, partial [Gammaproteobacteria bacterium]|nr:hypothetical protein [Gammaproteobacteria bacterium]
MDKKIIIATFIGFSSTFYLTAYAHNETTDSVDHEAERQLKEKQGDNDTWNSFMESVKAQETKKDPILP